MGLLKTLIKLLLWLVGLGVVALAALALLITTIDPNEHKGWIEARFHKETGRAISLDGPVAVTFYPWLGVEAADVSIADTEEFGSEPFATLDYLKLRVKSLPLLREEYEVDTVAVRGAVINLVRNEQGIANWDAFDGEAGESDRPMLPLAAVALGGVAIEGARVTLEDRQQALRYEFSEIDVSTAELKYGEPIDINLDFRARSDKPALDAAVSLAGIITYSTDGEQFALAPLDVDAVIKSGNIPGGQTAARLSARVDVDLDRNTAALSDFTLDTLDSSVAGNLSARHIDSSTPAIAATLDAQGKDLGLLFKVAEIEPLASQLARLSDRSFRISATLDADLERGDIDLSGLTARLLDADINGELKARNIHSETPGYQGELDAAGPDLPTLLQVLGQLQGGQDSALAVYGRKLAGIPARAFKLNTVFDADLKSGDVAVPTLALEALGINAAGALDARNMNSSKGTVQGNLNIRGQRMAGLLAALGQAELAEVLQSVELNTRVQGEKTSIMLETMSLEAVFAGADIPGSPAAMTLNADTRIDLDKETLTFDGLTLEGLGLKTAGRVEFADIFDEVSASGQLEVAPFNLRRLARQLKQELPETADDDAFTSVALSGRFDLSDAGLNLERMELQLDDTRLSGEFSIVETAPRPVTQFDLNLDQIDLDRYLPPDSQARQASGKAAGLSVVALAGTDLDGSLGIDRLVVSKARLDGFKMRLKARDGVLRAEPVTASLYEGRLSADVLLDANPDLPLLTLNTELAGIQAAPLLMDLTGKARLSGKGNFTAALTARGDSVVAMKRSLSGPMSLSFTEGAIAGFNLGLALRQWKQFKKGQIIAAEDSAATDFTEFTGNPVAVDGIIRMDDLALKAPAFRLQGGGVLADLHTDTIDYRAVATVVNTAKGAGGRELADLEGLALPLIVGGPLDDPEIRLAWEDILAGLLVEQVLDVLDLKLPGTRQPDTSQDGQETQEDREIDPLEELLKEGLKEGLKGYFQEELIFIIKVSPSGRQSITLDAGSSPA